MKKDLERYSKLLMDEEGSASSQHIGKNGLVTLDDIKKAPLIEGAKNDYHRDLEGPPLLVYIDEQGRYVSPTQANTQVSGTSKYGMYFDSKGYLTTGTGHLVTTKEKSKLEDFHKLNKKNAQELLKKDIKQRLPGIKRNIKNFDTYEPSTKDAIVSSWFRGSLPQSGKTMKLLNQGKLKEASREFLRNEEYRTTESGGIKRRMKRTSNAFLKESKKQGPYDHLPFDEAFERAYKDLGKGKVFKYRGEAKLLIRANDDEKSKKPKRIGDLVDKPTSNTLKQEKNKDLEVEGKEAKQKRLINAKKELDELKAKNLLPETKEIAGNPDGDSDIIDTTTEFIRDLFAPNEESSQDRLTSKKNELEELKAKKTLPEVEEESLDVLEDTEPVEEEVMVKDNSNDVGDYEPSQWEIDRDRQLEKIQAYKNGGLKYADGTEDFMKGLVPEEKEVMRDEYITDPNLPPVEEDYPDPLSGSDLEGLKFDMDKLGKVETDAITEPEMEAKTPEVTEDAMEQPEKADTVDTLKENLSPEEPKKKEEPFTKETLEQEFRKLMNVRKDRRRNAQWASAASMLASIFDSMAYKPMGLKPVQYKDEETDAEKKDLLDFAKLKGIGVSRGDYSRDPNSEASKRARENARGFGIEIPDTMTEDEIKRLLPSLLAIKRSEMVEFGKAGRQSKALGLQERKFQRKMEESDRPSDKQAERVESLKFAQDLTNKVSDQLTEKMEKFLGPVDSRLEAAKEYIPFADEGMDPEFAKFKANAVEQLASYIKDKSGAQVSDKERAFLEGALPKVTDKPKTFKAKLDMFKERLKMVQEGRLGSIKAQGKNVGEFEKLLNTEAGIDKSTTKSSPSVGSIIRHKGKRYRVVNEAGDLEEVK